MRKTTFYGLATFCGLGSLFFCFGLWAIFGGGVSSSPKSVRVEQDFLAIGNAVKTYQINAGRPPTTAQGLDVLLNEPKAGPKPRRWTQVMKKLPDDHWQTPYRYSLLTPKDSEWRWELRSAGRDGVFGSGDDISGEYESGSSIVPGGVRAGEKTDPRSSF